MCHLGMFSRLDISKIRREYERVKALTPVQAHIEYMTEKSKPEMVPSVDSKKVDFHIFQ